MLIALSYSYSCASHLAEIDVPEEIVDQQLLYATEAIVWFCEYQLQESHYLWKSVHKWHLNFGFARHFYWSIPADTFRCLITGRQTVWRYTTRNRRTFRKACDLIQNWVYRKNSYYKMLFKNNYWSLVQYIFIDCAGLFFSLWEVQRNLLQARSEILPTYYILKKIKKRNITRIFKYIKIKQLY